MPPPWTAPTGADSAWAGPPPGGLTPPPLPDLGGALVGPLFLVFPQMGDVPLIKGLAGILLGGMGSVPGAVVGGLILGLTESVSTLYLPTDYRDSIAFMVMVAILLLRPQGLFGQRMRGED